MLFLRMSTTGAGLTTYVNTLGGLQGDSANKVMALSDNYVYVLGEGYS